jgi:hypothetical protein
MPVALRPVSFALSLVPLSLMDSLTFTPGDAFLSSDSPQVPWTVVFEDEGPAGYCYACDRSHESQEAAILDAMLIYNSAQLEEASRERLAAVQWSRNGLVAVLYIDGTAQALMDFAARASFCRTNFPNFMGGEADGWRKDSHAWDDAQFARFESSLLG